MAIAKGYKTNFQTILKAAGNDELALLECREATTGRPVMTVCAVWRAGEERHFVPLAKLFDGNPYDELIPPA